MDADAGSTPLSSHLDDADRRVLDRAAATIPPALDRLRSTLTEGAGPPAERLKRDGTPVTTTDTAADRELTAVIREVFPDHGVVSEEQVTTAPDTRWTWVLDPVDGTANLAAGLPYWAVSVALCRAGHPAWAAVDAPALDWRCLARRGRGASANGRPLELGEPVDPTAGTSRHVPLLVTAGVLRRATGRSGLNPRVHGSVALDLCQVAAGRAAAAVFPRPHVWDLAAGQLVLEEAGGVLVTLGDRRPLLPLRPGTDYAERTAPVAAGPGSAWVRKLLARLELAPDEREGPA